MSSKSATNEEPKDFELAAFDLTVTQAIRMDFVESVGKIYRSIRDNPGDDNAILEDCG